MIERIQKALVAVAHATAHGVITENTEYRFVEFLKSIRTQTTTGRNLSPGQTRYLTDIEDRCCEEKITEAKDWINQYNDELREVAVTCAQYYHNAPDENSYFLKIRSKVLADPKGHVLSKRDFDKMCCNKYAVKVLNEMKTEPRFKIGQIVQVRKTNRLDMAPYKDSASRRYAYGLYRKAARDGKLFAVVVKINPRPIYRATPGGKVYKILPLGESKPVIACEKDLKFAKGVG